MKEQQPLGISELQQKLGKIDQALGKANRVSQAIGTPEFGRPELDISPSSQLDGNAYLDAAIRVGRVRKALAENAIPKLNDSKDQTQKQIDDLKAQNEATEKLQQIRELVGAGYIPATVLERGKEVVMLQEGNVVATETDRYGESVKKSPRQPVLTEEFVQRLRDEFLGGLPDDIRLRALHYYREDEQNLLGEQGATQIDGWREYLRTLEIKQVARISFVIGAATRAGIKTVGDVRQLTLEELSSKGIVHQGAQFLIHAFQKTTLARDIDKESSLAVGRAAQTPLKEAEIKKTSPMLQVEKALGIDIATYLKEEYETRERSILDIIQDIRDKTNGEIRTSDKAVAGWLKICHIDTRSLREASKLSWQDPLKREARLVGRNTPEAKRKMSEARKRRFANEPERFLAMGEMGRRVAAQKRHDAEQATLKAKFGDNPKEALKSLYVTERFSIQRVAEKSGVSRRTISGWFKMFEIPLEKVVLKPEATDTFNRADTLDLLTTLEPRERQVLEDRYNKRKTLKEIGTELGITRERVRQIESGALSILRRQLKFGLVTQRR